MKKYIITITVLLLFSLPLFSAPTVEHSSTDGKLVVINRVKNSVVIGFAVTLENTVITYKDLKIFIHDTVKKSRKNLSSLLHALTKVGADADDLINILSILHRAGSLDGKLVVI